MKPLRSKLNNQRGATMMLALLLFFVCAMISAVVVMAASANSDRTTKRREEQRNYLAVMSAYELLSKELDKVGTYSGEESRLVYSCYTSDPPTTSCPDHPDVITALHRAEDCEPGCELGEYLFQMAHEVALTRTTMNIPAAASEKVERQFSIEAINMPDVNVKMTMTGVEDSVYDIRIVVSVPDTSASLVFRLDGAETVTTPTPPAPIESTTVSHIIRKQVQLPNGEWEWRDVEKFSDEQTSTRTISVSWTALGDVTKGVG